MVVAFINSLLFFKMISIHSRMLCAKFCCNENAKKGGMAFHEWTWITLTQGSFVPSLIALAFNCRKSQFYKFPLCNFDISLSRWKKLWASIWTKLNSLYSRMLCATFGWNWQSDSREEDTNVKSLQTDGQPANRKARLSFQLRWAKSGYQFIWS